MKLLKHNLTSVVLVSVLVISVFMLLLTASISYRQIQTLKKSQESIVRSYQIYAELEHLNSYAADAETGQRGFILTRDSIFLQPYYKAIEKIKWSFARLDLLTEDNYNQQKSLDSVVFLLNQRMRYLDMVLVNREIEISIPDTLKKLMLRGRELMGETLSQIDRMIFNELQALKYRETEHENEAKLTPIYILFVVVFSLLIFIISFYTINKKLREITIISDKLKINDRIWDNSEQMANISHWYWDMKENKLTYSLNLYRLLGCKPGEFEPSFESLLNFVHPADRHLLDDINKKAPDEAKPVTIFFRVLRRDGELRNFKSTRKAITDDYGKSFSIGVDADVTEEFKKDRIIGEKISDMEKSNKQLSAFSHIASHDLQEPLRKIQTFISRIKENDMVVFPENIKDYLSGIKKETIRMQKFITDLLLYSRASKADKTFEVADLNEILENSKRELSHRIEEKNAIINSSELPVIRVIPFQMQQLFSNLISNSIKYSKIDINPIIDVSAEAIHGKDVPGNQGDGENRFYKISFSDNGIGFDSQYSEKIFTLFYRLHSNKDYSGTGIGLAICRIIVDNHKGYITANGIPGAGATFTIYIPAK